MAWVIDERDTLHSLTSLKASLVSGRIDRIVVEDWTLAAYLSKYLRSKGIRHEMAEEDCVRHRLDLLGRLGLRRGWGIRITERRRRRTKRAASKDPLAPSL